MAKINISWPQFAVCNENPTKSFEDMCRRLFTAEYLKGKVRPHANHNNAGIEVLPILEAEREDGQPRKRISFQCKYTDQPSYAYSEFQKSAKTTAKEYKGKLDKVYLFCNKTLTTTTKAYQSIVSTHSVAGIETVPVSNDEVLDMVADHPDIAEYYFQARIIADTTGLQPTVINGIPVYMVSADQIISPETVKPDNEEALKELVAEKLEKCKSHALALELDALKSEVEKLNSYGIIDSQLYYYQLLVVLHEGKDVRTILEKCADKYKAEAEWLVGFYASPSAISADEFEKHTSISQIFAVEKLFSMEHWHDIVQLYEETTSCSDQALRIQLDLHYGLSLMNLQENEKAREALQELYARAKEPRIQFYEICAEIRIENEVYQNGMAGHHDKLAKLIDELDTLKELKQYTQQELFIAALKMESYYHLGIVDKEYLECAIEEYNTYQESTKKNTIIRFYYALCLELNGDRGKAISAYETLDWKADQSIVERYMICLILSEEPEKAVKIYREIERPTPRVQAVYLFALERSGAENYFTELQKLVDDYRDNLGDFFPIAYFTDSDTKAKEIVLPVLRELLSEEDLRNLPFYQRVEIITYLAQSREVELMEEALKAIDDISLVNNFVAGEIYKALFDIANKEYSREKKSFHTPEALDAAERVADKFLLTDVSRRNFLQVKILCVGAKKMPFSSLYYSKELFEITHDAETARNVVALLFDRKETNPAEYTPYLEVLEKSDKPDHCLVTACAMLLLGREDMAEFYAYKALYLLNGEDNYFIYRSYFGFCNYNLHEFRINDLIHTVKGGVVVSLEEDISDNPHHLDICLDQEADFTDESNRSMDVEHLTSSNSEYIRLRGCGLGQILRFRGRKYKITQIVSRNYYGLGYIFRKIQEKPEMFQGVAWTISTENIDEMIKQIKELTDNSEQVKSMLASYNFEESEVGLPIDAVAFWDYSQYIAAFKYLLFQKDEAFYAGQPTYENETGQKYVLGLATLILLAVLDRLDVLDGFKHDIIIPESYISFFQEEYSKAAGVGQMSSSTLYFVDDKPVMQDADKSIPDIWEAVLRFCQSCTTSQISDCERINFKIADGLTGERFVSGLRLNTIHLDALLLSKREKATLLCDDLFFRKIATWIGVRNLNIVSLIQHYTDSDFMVPFIKELAKTNYIYIPLRARDDDEFIEILGYLLEGKRKEAYYSGIIQRFIDT